MIEPKTEQPPAAVVLTANCIVDGRFYQAGARVPFTTAADLPESLKPLLATADAPPPEPFSRNIYDLPHPALRRQARMLEHAVQEREWAIEELNKPLPAETRLALQDAHDKSISIALAQAEANQRFRDAAYEQAAAAAEPPRRFVRRGGEWGRIERAKLKPGEHVFALRPNGEYETVGTVDSRGEPPPPEITT